MLKISIREDQPALEADKIAAVFLKTGMSEDESDYYAEQIIEGAGFEIGAPENDLVTEMIASLRQLGVALDSTSETDASSV